MFVIPGKWREKGELGPRSASRVRYDQPPTRTTIDAVRVAAGQIRTDLDKVHNLALVQAAAQRAADAGAELLVLPEASMCSFGEDSTDLVPLAESLDGPFVTALLNMAQQLDIHLVAGMFESGASEGRVFNTLVGVGPRGLLGSYRKIHLYDALGWCESDRFEPGDAADDSRYLLMSIGDCTVGVMNCYDLRFPEMARVLTDRGANVVAVAAHFVSGAGKAVTWATLLAARAIENTSYAVAAGQPGPEATGHSMVLSPLGSIIDSVGENDFDVQAVGEVDIKEIARVRKTIPVLAQRHFRVVPLP
jgi:deaminated glutathione amidase